MYWAPLPMLVLGIPTLFAAGLALLLAETSGQDLPSNMADSTNMVSDCDYSPKIFLSKNVTILTCWTDCCQVQCCSYGSYQCRSIHSHVFFKLVHNDSLGKAGFFAKGHHSISLFRPSPCSVWIMFFEKVFSDLILEIGSSVSKLEYTSIMRFKLFSTGKATEEDHDD